MRGHGKLALGKWGRQMLERYRSKAEAVAHVTRQHRDGPERPALELELELGAGVRLRGTLGGFFPGGRVEHTYSKRAPKRIWRGTWNCGPATFCDTGFPKSGLATPSESSVQLS